MIKKGLLLSKDGCHYYFYSKDDTNDSVVSLRYSKYGNWNSPYLGKEVVRIVDDGNGADITMNGETKRMNYGDLGDLMLALQVYSKYHNMISEHKTVITKSE